MDKIQTVLEESKKRISKVAWYTLLIVFIYFNFFLALPACFYCTFKTLCAFTEMQLFVWITAMVLVLAIDIGFITFGIYCASDLYDLIKKETTK